MILIIYFCPNNKKHLVIFIVIDENGMSKIKNGKQLPIGVDLLVGLISKL